MVSLKIKCSNESAFTVDVDVNANVLALKTHISDHFSGTSPTPTDSQRLIFAGKVLKDDELLTTYKVQDGNTIHLVRGNKPAASPSSTAPSPVARTPVIQPQATAPAQFDMFQNGGAAASNPMGGLGPDGVAGMMNNPMFATMMSQMMSNPQMLDTMIQSNPQLASVLSPQMREQMQSPQFRAMMSNPQFLQQMLSMQGGMGGMGAGMNPLANMQGQNPNPDGSFPNPFANSNNSSSQMPGFDPAMMQMLMGGANAGAAANSSNPAQPPEVLYETQLVQLQDMGFYSAAENIRALQMTGGNIEAAVEWLFSHPAGSM